MQVETELKKIASQVEDKSLADELIKISSELEKKASLIEEGNNIVCVNPIQGLFKGRVYVAGPKIQDDHAFIEVFEDDGTKVGIFNSGRFLLDWGQY